MIIDMEDYDWWKNKLKIQLNNKGYARKKIRGKDRLMHRVYMEYKTGKPIPDNLVVHHKNGNRLDNRFRNLEITTQMVNSQTINTLKKPKYKPYLEVKNDNGKKTTQWRVKFRVMGKWHTANSIDYKVCIQKRNKIFEELGLPVPDDEENREPDFFQKNHKNLAEIICNAIDKMEKEKENENSGSNTENELTDEESKLSEDDQVSPIQ